ncbi:MAG: hypothetical protein O7F70_09410, partial [Gemmatimonadetes bacterium]|nr:hypothetical protein [Gemmatimonadota bacterium]
SDSIVGLMPIEDERGPGQRTEVYTATLDRPIVASRSERGILQDMAFAGDELLRFQETREIMSDLADALDDVPDVVKRMLNHEAHFDAHAWVRRIQETLRADGEPSDEQSDFFE